MDELVKEIEKLRENDVKNLVDERMKEFSSKTKEDDIFSELCFCILTANYSAEGGIRIQKAIGGGFYSLSESELAGKLKELGHRFPNARAEYIAKAKTSRDALKNVLANEGSAREWLVKNIKGIGYKEASHFLRNTGYNNFAIIDFHIIDLLARYGLIEKPKTLTKKKYIEIEEVLKSVAKKVNMNLAELDLYLWYMETGKILK